MMVEIIIVISIVTILVLTTSTVAQKAIYLSRQSVHQAQAAFILEEGTEAVRITRDNAWSTISGLSLDTDYYLDFSGGTWNLSTTPSQIGIFTRKVVLSAVYRDANQDIAVSGTIDNQAKLITITTSWAEGDKTLSKTIQFYLMDIFS